MTHLVWFRRDLRVRDHPALWAAADAQQGVVPVFCFDDRLLNGRHASGVRTAFLLESLRDLDDALTALGTRLIVRHGAPETVLPQLAAATGATDVHYTGDVSPFARYRARAVRQALSAAGIAEHAHPGLTAADDVSVLRTTTGGPYSVFGPFHRNWEGQPRRTPLARPARLAPAPDTDPGRLPTPAELGLEHATGQPQKGGERAARERLKHFLDGPVHRYAESRDALDQDGTSRLSAYLHFGCLSAREVEYALPDGEGPAAFRRQLCWRDFYHHVLLNNPGNARREYQPRYRETLAWPGDDELFDAWRHGRTGYPLVDAGMRQLRREGWMHNRARLVAGSFLTKHLGVDWRRGEAWFMRMLIDGDEADNNGNWQWIASVGVDPQPVYRRLYNPTLHLKRYDPEGGYVREYVPELRGVPAPYLAEPWTMPEDVQRAAHCVIGDDYPRPVVDLATARAEALARYAVAGRGGR